MSDILSGVSDNISFLSLLVDPQEIDGALASASRSLANFRDWVRKVEEAGSVAITVVRSDGFRGGLNEEEKVVLDRVRIAIDQASEQARGTFEGLARILIPLEAVTLIKPLTDFVLNSFVAESDVKTALSGLPTLAVMLNDSQYMTGEDEDGANCTSTMTGLENDPKSGCKTVTESLDDVLTYIKGAEYTRFVETDTFPIFSLFVLPHVMEATEADDDVVLQVHDGLRQLLYLGDRIGSFNPQGQSEADQQSLGDLARRIKNLSETETPTLEDHKMLKPSDMALIPQVSEIVTAARTDEDAHDLWELMNAVVSEATETLKPDEATEVKYFDKWSALRNGRIVAAMIPDTPTARHTTAAEESYTNI